MIPKAYRKFLLIWRGRLALGLLRIEARLASSFGMRGLYYRHLAELVQQTGLFNAQWYLETNPDVREDGVDPLAHYVRHGDREGRQPMPLFDPPYYRAHARAHGGTLISLLHYTLLGRLLKVSTSAWFDVEYYLRQNRDVARAGVDPLRHYLETGGLEGRSPCRQFDAAFYLRAHPDVQHAQVNPLLHYLERGRLEGRRVTLGEGEEERIAPPPVEVAMDGLPRISKPDRAVLDVVVPVYRGRAETLRCLRSVLIANTGVDFELVVINDASPDGELVAALERLADEGLFTLLHNAANLGFVATANRGMNLHPQRDVLLLNADTEVFGDWIDRLRRAAYREPRNGTVTPLSNNATIASYPRFLHDNPYPLEIPFAEIDRLAAKVNHGMAQEAPTGVGFCMYLRRDCLEQVGLFDEEAFGKGYGEENDLCQRAIAAGWRNLIAADVFVHHLGSVSFQGERARRVSEALRVLDRRHPSYQRDVRDFIARDPLAEARRNLDWARLGLTARAHSILMVCHNRGGGAERHLREDTARLLAEGRGVFYLRPVQGIAGTVRISDPLNLQLPNQPSFLLARAAELVAALRDLGIDAIHVHGTVDFDPEAPEQLVEIAAQLGATLEIEVHDYHTICPRVNLADAAGRYCGEPAERDCDQCLVTQGNKYGVRSIRSWRHSNAQMLRAADRIWVPDPDVGERLRRYYPDLICAVSPHEDIDTAELPTLSPVLGEGEMLRVVVVGAISKVKGYDVLLTCARDAQERDLPLFFALLGYSMDDARLMQAGVRVSGRYLEQEGMQRLEALQPHAVWLPSLWPETYSYTLSMALRGGYPVFGFDIGAIGRRLRALGLAQHLAPLGTELDPRAMNARFLAFRESCLSRRMDVA